MSITKKGTGRPVIALFLSWTHDAYHIPIWKTIAARCKERDINLLLFCGDIINKPITSNSFRPSIYHISHPELFDGIILTSSSMFSYVAPKYINQFCSDYRSIPMVSIGIELEGIPSVLIDNSQGTYDLVRHLIEIHGCRKFAYFAGPRGSYDDALRYRGFCRALKDFNLPCDEEFFFEGNFSYRHSRQIIEILLNQSKLNFDALVCANDSTAIGAIDHLQAAGYHLPLDLPIVGFDNTTASQYVNPPLTTVNLPLEQLGEKAFELLLNKIEGKKVPSCSFLPAPMIIRQSCGCLPATLSQKRIKVAEKVPPRPEQDLTKWQEKMSREFIAAFQIPPHKYPAVSRWMARFLGALEAFLANEQTSTRVIHSFSTALLEMARTGHSQATWEKYLKTLQDKLVEGKPLRNSQLKIRGLFEKIAIHLKESFFRIKTYKRFNFWDESIEANSLYSRIMLTFDIPAFIKNITDQLPLLDIHNCYIVR